MRIGDAIIQHATTVTKAWTHHQKRVIRTSGRASWRPPRARKDTIKDIARRIMPEAYRMAAGTVGMAAPRQIFYAARPLILAQLNGEKDLSSVYFTQVLLPDYMAAHPTTTASWDLLWDDRGHFREPHTRQEIGLGTLAVRRYLAKCRAGAATELAVDPIGMDFPTYGPEHRFRHVLLIEKEGFQQLFEHVGIDTRYDLAIMSSKGMNTTAARTLVEQLPGVRILVLHDFDKAGFSILGTLTRSTRRYQFSHQADIVDLGIRLGDVETEGLAAEPVQYRGEDPGQNLRANGATSDEVEFLVDGGQRVEINAFTSDQLIRWLEAKLEAAGVVKVIPDEDTLIAAYRRACYVRRINAELVNCHARATEEATSIRPPADLREAVEAALSDDPSQSWDEALAGLLTEDDDAS